MNKSRSVLFLTLNTFSSTGGIEKVCRIVAKALNELYNKPEDQVIVYSLHDATPDAANNIYFPDYKFKGFKGKISSFILSSIKLKRQPLNTVVLSHINLLIVGYLIKLMSPKTELILFCHGIEIWNRQSFLKRKMLNACHKIIAVSNFTKQKIVRSNGIPENKVLVINNCLDPFLEFPESTNKSVLLTKYGLPPSGKILLSVTRYSNKEKYKGYDNVIKAISFLIPDHPDLCYLLVGKYDTEEKERIDKLISEYNLNGKVIFTGFVKDEELAAHFRLGDIFIMPSRKEGFGIVFIEAMFYGLPVIGGNQDGTTDALLNGRLGTLVDPNNYNEIKKSIEKILADPERFAPDKNLLMENFSYEIYRSKLKSVLLKKEEHI